MDIRFQRKDAYLCFQIGQSEFILHDYDKAVSYYERGMAPEPPVDVLYIQIITRVYIELGKRQSLT